MSKLYNLDKLKEVAQGDDAFVHEMVITFIDSVSEEIANIQKYTAESEWKAIEKIAHKIAPNFAYIDAESLYVLAADIETKIQNGHDLTEIETMTHQLCADSLVLLDELRKNHSNIKSL